MKRKLATFWRSLSPRRRKLTAWVGGLALFYTIFGFLALPLIVRAVASKRLARELSRDVVIQSVRMNPYALSCSVRGLLIKDRDGEPFVSWERLDVNLQLASLFGRPWVFREIALTNSYARVQMNKGYTFNFSDLIEKFLQARDPRKPAKPLALRIGQLRIGGARASLTDLTLRRPFQRAVGPFEVTLNHFHTDPRNKNPYSFAGSTESGEVFSWSGHFFLNPIRADGELSIANVALSKYTALYQDRVKFEVEDGIASFRGTYRFVKSPGTNVVLLTNVSAALRSFKLRELGATNLFFELPGLTLARASADLLTRYLEAGSLSVTGAMLNLHRAKDASINLVEMTKPSDPDAHAPGAILFLLRAATNVFSMLLEKTNAATAILRDLAIENCGASLQDDVCSRPVRLDIDQFTLTAKNLSNLPGTNLNANLSLRWNTNGTVKTELKASLFPLSAELRLLLERMDLRPLDPYLEPYLNLFVTGSELGLDGRLRLRGEPGQLPAVTFTGGSRLDGFATADGVRTNDLIKWGSLQFDGIEANLHPPEVSVTKVSLIDAYARLALETNRTVNLLAALRPGGTNQSAASERPPPAAPPPRRTLAQVKDLMSRTNGSGMTNLPKINVATVVISNAHLQLTDASLQPNARISLQQIHGTLTDLSSDELRRAHIHLKGKMDNTGLVEITGRLNPLHQDAASEVKVVVKEVDLLPTDPYTGKYLGYRLRKGKLSVEANYNASARHLKGQNLIRLDQFTLSDKVDSPDATKLPVKLGLALLKDRSGRIELDVPVEGNLDDPEFRLGRVVWRAVVNVFAKIATSPFAVLGSLLGGKGEEISYQEFEPGGSDLLPAAREKLDALIKGLYERPGLEVEIEGHTDLITDGDALRRRKLEQQLRVRKWTSLRKPEQAAATPEQLVLTAEERGRLLVELYQTAVGQAAGGERPKPSSQSPVARSPARSTGKGAEALAHSAPKPEARQQVLSEMERQLLETLSVEESELHDLAAQRAQGVRDHLVQSGQVEAERVSLSPAAQSHLGTNGHRVYLRLQ